jgi:DNA primase
MREDLVINLENRIVFPIRSISGDVVSFGGRSLSDGVPKYLNGISSEHYDKSRVLYNLDIAYDYIISSGLAVVTEGYMDVASLWDSGIRNVVATCGTAMTRWHVRALKPYADKMPVFTVSGLSGIDPDEYIKIFGKESLLQLIDGAKEEKKR